MRSIPVLMLLTLYSLNNFAQQHHYEFNRPGSECNFEYIMYSALQDEMAYRRPFIFVLCKLNESIDKTFEEDTLRNLPQFYNYNFVYVPNKGGAIQSKLSCFPSLVSLLTRSFKSRNNNIFLYIYDTTISAADIQAMEESSYSFKATFKNKVVSAGTTTSDATSLVENFKASSI